MKYQKVIRSMSRKSVGKSLSRAGLVLGALMGVLISPQVQARDSARISCPKTLTVQMQFQAASRDERINNHVKFSTGHSDVDAASRTGLTYTLTLSGAPTKTCYGQDSCNTTCNYVDDLKMCVDTEAGQCKSGTHSLEIIPGLDGQSNSRFFSTIRLGKTVFPVLSRVAPFSEKEVRVLPDLEGIQLKLTDLLNASELQPPRAGVTCWDAVTEEGNIVRDCTSDYSSGGDPLQPVYLDPTVTRVLGWVTELSFTTR